MKLSQLKHVESLVKHDGECSGENSCYDCIIREHLEDPDDCSIEECYDIACELLHEYNNLYRIEGNCITIWGD